MFYTGTTIDENNSNMAKLIKIIFSRKKPVLRILNIRLTVYMYTHKYPTIFLNNNVLRIFSISI